MHNPRKTARHCPTDWQAWLNVHVVPSLNLISISVPVVETLDQDGGCGVFPVCPYYHLHHRTASSACLSSDIWRIGVVGKYTSTCSSVYVQRNRDLCLVLVRLIAAFAINLPRRLHCFNVDTSRPRRPNFYISNYTSLRIPIRIRMYPADMAIKKVFAKSQLGCLSFTITTFAKLGYSHDPMIVCFGQAGRLRSSKSHVADGGIYIRCHSSSQAHVYVSLTIMEDEYAYHPRRLFIYRNLTT